MQESDCLEQRLWYRLKCFMVLASRRAQSRYNWEKYEELCKPQANEVIACFDLLTGFFQGNCSVDEWHNVVLAQINLARYPQKQPRSCIGIFSVSFCVMCILYPKPLMIRMWI